MIVHDVRQNSEQWEALRRGIPTASEMEKIVCPEWGTGYRCDLCGEKYKLPRKKCKECEGEVIPVQVVKASTQATAYMYKLIAESMGFVDQKPGNYWTERGHEIEAEAIAQYEILKDTDTQVVGFCTTDDGLIGASPDRLVGEDGLVEAKCPSPWVHIRHLVEQDLDKDHRVQCLGQLLVTGRKYVDVISYHPGMDAVVMRVERDEAFISGMNDRLYEFIVKYQETRARLIAKYGDFSRNVAAAASDPLGVSPLDAEVVLAGQREEW